MISIGSLGNLKPTADLSMLKMHITMDQRLKNGSIHNRLGKRVVDQDWADYEEGIERKYVRQEGQWCLGGLTRS